MIEDTNLEKSFGCGESEGAFWACQDRLYGMFVSCRRISEDTKLAENVGCGVSRWHCGRAKIAHKECLYSASG